MENDIPGLPTNQQMGIPPFPIWDSVLNQDSQQIYIVTRFELLLEGISIPNPEFTADNEFKFVGSKGSAANQLGTVRIWFTTCFTRSTRPRRGIRCGQRGAGANGAWDGKNKAK